MLLWRRIFTLSILSIKNIVILILIIVVIVVVILPVFNDGVVRLTKKASQQVQVSIARLEIAKVS
jgi:hypothetical protein